MKSLLGEILEKMALVDLAKISQSDPQEVGAGENVLGVMSDDLKRLHVVYCDFCAKLSAECKRVQSELYRMEQESPEKVPEEARTLSEEHNALHLRCDKLRDIFWMFVSAEFPQTAEDRFNVAIRKYWQVIVYPNGNEELSGLMGWDELIARARGLRGNTVAEREASPLNDLGRLFADIGLGDSARQYPRNSRLNISPVRIKRAGQFF